VRSRDRQPSVVVVLEPVDAPLADTVDPPETAEALVDAFCTFG